MRAAMEIQRLLKEMEATAKALSNLYDYFSTRFQNDPQASALFYRLAIEERGHGRAIALFIRIMQGNPFLLTHEAFLPDNLSMAKALLTHGRLQSVLMSFNEVVGFLWFFESELGAGYRLVHLAEACPGLSQLLTSLAQVDHTQRLAILAKTRGIPLQFPERFRDSGLHPGLAAVAQ